jgi:hypothetical protein
LEMCACMSIADVFFFFFWDGNSQVYEYQVDKMRRDVSTYLLIWRSEDGWCSARSLVDRQAGSVR